MPSLAARELSAVAAPRRIRLAFVIGEMTVGGAEMMLWKLVSRLDRTRFEPLVVALSGRTDSMRTRFEAIDTPCLVIGMRSRTDFIPLLRLPALLRECRPDLLQGWMYYGNLAATFVAPFIRPCKPAVLWSIRGTLNLAQERRLSKYAIRLGAALSSLPRRIINNSKTSAIEHEQRLGYRPENRVVVPNGFDTDVFRPREDARAAIRGELGIPPDAVVIGLIGRYHPMKDHETFIRAAALVNAKHAHVYFVLAGEDVDAANDALQSLIVEHGLGAKIRLLGPRDDMERVTAALDVAASSSCAGEGFSNVIGEAMSCGVPCVATDVGDAAFIMGETGKVVVPGDAAALAGALLHMIELGGEARRELGRRAREIIIERFSLDAVVRRYEALYAAVYAEHAG